jgi:hypothetical protein
MEKKEWIIAEDGNIRERTTLDRELDAEDQVLEALSENLNQKVRHFLNIPEWGNVHASVGRADILWSVRIHRIPLKARFRLVNQVLVPMFASQTDLEMPMTWTAPEQVRLVLAIKSQMLEDYHTVAGNWLFAFKDGGNAYRLPLPNLFDDCAVCTGDFETSYDSAEECVRASLTQFEKSKWNADLMQTVEQSQKFFRFRPTNETFETLPIDAEDWTTLCKKVSTAIMDRVII